MSQKKDGKGPRRIWPKTMWKIYGFTINRRVHSIMEVPSFSPTWRSHWVQLMSILHWSTKYIAGLWLGLTWGSHSSNFHIGLKQPQPIWFSNWACIWMYTFIFLYEVLHIKECSFRLLLWRDDFSGMHQREKSWSEVDVGRVCGAAAAAIAVTAGIN